MSRRAPFPFPVPASALAIASERLLCIDLGANATGLSHDAEGAVHTAALPALTADLLALVRPDRVICALFGSTQDACAVIERLQALEYGGQITVISPALPRPKLVEAELRAMGPAQRLTLLLLA